MAEKADLKPCPFCGSSDIRIGPLAFQCGHCNAVGPTEKKKANWWERRTTDYVDNFWNTRKELSDGRAD